jgi:hypothetical protein
MEHTFVRKEECVFSNLKGIVQLKYSVPSIVGRVSVRTPVFPAFIFSLADERSISLLAGNLYT